MVEEQFRSFNTIASFGRRTWDVPGYPDERYSIELKEDGSPKFPMAVQIPSITRRDKRIQEAYATLTDDQIAKIKERLVAGYLGEKRAPEEAKRLAEATWRDHVTFTIPLQDRIEDVLLYMQIQGCKLTLADLAKTADITDWQAVLRWIYTGDKEPEPVPESEQKPPTGKQKSNSRQKHRG